VVVTLFEEVELAELEGQLRWRIGDRRLYFYSIKWLPGKYQDADADWIGSWYA
jgi:hypothetical protein